MRASPAPLVAGAALLLAVPAFGAIDPNAAVVLVRQDCGSMDDCFEDMSTLADPTTGWIWTVRNPTAGSPLLVDIGPGAFGRFVCPDGRGHVTLRGSGREQTTLAGTFGGITATNCTKLAFEHLRAEGTRYGAAWYRLGDSTWTNVDIATVAPHDTYINLAWVDECEEEDKPERSVHYFFGSRVKAAGVSTLVNAAFYLQCSEIWFFGGEVLADDDGTGLGSATTAIWVARYGDFRAFGTAVRTRQSVYSPKLLRGVVVDDNVAPGNPPPAFHLHGGIINVTGLDGPGGAVNVVALRVEGGLAHTPGSAYVVKPGAGGTATRVQTAGSGVAQVPFLWQSGATPPSSVDEMNAVASEDGKDMFVETDCGASGDCTAGGNEAHLMIYNAARCGATDPWFDSVTGRCRNDTGT